MTQERDLERKESSPCFDHPHFSWLPSTPSLNPCAALAMHMPNRGSPSNLGLYKHLAQMPCATSTTPPHSLSPNFSLLACFACLLCLLASLHFGMLPSLLRAPLHHLGTLHRPRGLHRSSKPLGEVFHLFVISTESRSLVFARGKIVKIGVLPNNFYHR